MSYLATIGLGAIAGLTIFLGIPVARIGRPGRTRMTFLNAASVGVLLFIFFDVIKAAVEPIEGALDDHQMGIGVGYGLVLAAGLAVGTLGLVVFEAVFKPQVRREGPGAMSAEVTGRPDALAPMVRVAVFIAVGIGLHNFSEGLAIGQSAHSGAYRLFGLLVIGFGLHNITEGFGITAPLTGTRPSWRLLGVLGLIGGGPTFFGAVLGYAFQSVGLSVLFFGLAAGAILYVVGELQNVGRKLGRPEIAMSGLLAGFCAGLGTDILLHVAGG